MNGPVAQMPLMQIVWAVNNDLKHIQQRIDEIDRITLDLDYAIGKMRIKLSEVDVQPTKEKE